MTISSIDNSIPEYRVGILEEQIKTLEVDKTRLEVIIATLENKCFEHVKTINELEKANARLVELCDQFLDELTPKRKEKS